MDIKDLKNKLTSLDDSFMIFKCEDNFWLAQQYVNEIVKNRKLEINYINSLAETQDSSVSLILEYTPMLNILIVDEFNELYEDYSSYINCIVICKFINKTILTNVEQFMVVFPKLTDWQIKDYMKVICKGISADVIDWLYDVTGGDIYRIVNELDKINVFNLNEQEEVLYNLKIEPNSDLYSFEEFYLVNNILENNIANIAVFLKLDKCRTINSVELVSKLIKKYKQILFTRFNSGLSAEQIGISDKNYIFIQRNNKYDYITEAKCKNILKFLTDTDYNIKNGLLSIADKDRLEYVVCKIIQLNIK